LSTAEIDNLLTKEVTDSKTPSVRYLIFDKDKILHSFHYGNADILNQKPVSEQTTFLGYSITKTFTALAIMQLADQQKIDLDLPVIKYLPDFPYNPEITVRQLLNHTAGVPNPIPLSWIHLAADHASFDSKAFFQKIYRKHAKTKSRPNARYAYSNLGYVLLGEIIESVSGNSYQEYVQKNILDRLKLNPGDLSFAIADPGMQAKGYHKRNTVLYFMLDLFLDTDKFMDQKEGKWKSFKSNYVNGAAYGGLIGTPNALVKYIQELLQPESKLISNAGRKEMFTENYTSNGKATGMCLSWFKGRLNGNTYLAHAGGGGGYYCEIRIYPEKGIGSVIMFNRTGISDERFLDKTDKFIVDEK